MALQVSWYRKYRPKTFTEYAGGFADGALKRFLTPDKRPQIILLHGHYGCGKTTAARLLAGYYLCTSLTDEGTPCGKCAGCRQLLDLIETGEDDASSESIQELNGSVVNGVDDMRRIMQTSMLTLPSFSKYKVFIIDECHRITPEAQNALLKILEDVPPYLVIIFATTLRDKLLPTVISRCQLTIEVRKQTVASMVDILDNIAKKEGLSFGTEALKLIAKKGDRIPRDCINLLEDIATMYDGQVTVSNVLARTGEVDTAVYFRFIQAAHEDLVHVLTFISEFSAGDISYTQFLSGLSRFVLDAVYARLHINTVDMDKDYLKTLTELFKMYKVTEFHVLLRLVDEASRRAVTGSTDLALSVLALNIGGITKVQAEISGDNVKSQATIENSIGAKKYVERDTSQRLADNAPKGQTVDLDDFMAGLGAIRYEGEAQ